MSKNISKHRSQPSDAEFTCATDLETAYQNNHLGPAHRSTTSLPSLRDSSDMNKLPDDDADKVGKKENDTSSPSLSNPQPLPTTITSDKSLDYEANDPAANALSFRFLSGMMQDLAVRWPLYKSDWGRPRSVINVVNATLYAFVIQLIPALIFAEIMKDATEGNLSTAETLLSSAVAGILYAVFAGQPLTLLGITGLVAILVKTSYSLAATFDAEYFPYFFWTCFWGGVFHLIAAMTGVVSLVWKVTPFTTQIFEFFTAITFLHLALDDLLGPLLERSSLTGEERYAELSLHYATFLLGLLTMYIAWVLHFAEQWGFFTRQVRIFLTRYNTMIAVVVVTAVSYIPAFHQAGNGAHGLERVKVEFPWNWQPSADRPWLTNPLNGIGPAGIFGAMIPGLMFFLLFFIDHNVSSILAQSPSYNLEKPPAYHWDFFILGVTFLPCAMLGLPPASGLIPQAPLHTRALCTREYFTDAFGVKQERVTHCEEQRWSALGQACLMFVALGAFRVISWIPRGALFGLLLYLGMGALHGNEVWERLLLLFILPKRRPQIPVVRHVEWKVARTWTFIQTLCTLAIWAVATFVEDIG
jgi:boron transporter